MAKESKTNKELIEYLEKEKGFFFKNQKEKEECEKEFKKEGYSKFFSPFKELFILKNDINLKEKYDDKKDDLYFFQLYPLSKKYNGNPDYLFSKFLKSSSINKHFYNKKIFNYKNLKKVNKIDFKINEILRDCVGALESSLKSLLVKLIAKNLENKKSDFNNWKQIINNKKYFILSNDIQNYWFWFLKYEWSISSFGNEKCEIDDFFQKYNSKHKKFVPIWHAINYLTFHEAKKLLIFLKKLWQEDDEKFKNLILKELKLINLKYANINYYKKILFFNWESLCDFIDFSIRLRNSIAHLHKFQHFILEERKNIVIKNLFPLLKNMAIRNINIQFLFKKEINTIENIPFNFFNILLNNKTINPNITYKNFQSTNIFSKFKYLESITVGYKIIYYKNNNNKSVKYCIEESILEKIVYLFLWHFENNV